MLSQKQYKYMVAKFLIPALRSLAILAFFIFLNACSAIYWLGQGELSDLVQAVHQEVNRYRVFQGLRPLTLDPFISKVAMRHSQEMADRDIPFGHEGLVQRAQTIRKRYPYSRVAENIGAIKGYNNPATEIVEGWLQSSKHLKNIRGDFELTGVGIAKSRSGVYYFTQIFVRM